MLKILRNLKNSFWSVLVIIIFLCIQAIADLALPDFTSKIVNVGIQSGGIENTAPEVIRKDKMDDILLFTEQDSKILNKYTLLSKDSLTDYEYQEYVKKYPALEKEDLYLQKEISKEEQEELNNYMEKPTMTLYTIQNTNKDLISMIKTMPEKDLSNAIKEYTTKVDQMPDTIIEQTAILAVKDEYQAIGINMEQLQNRYILVTGLQMLGVALISMTTAVIIIFLSSRVAAKLGKTLREKIFKKVLKFSNAEFTEFSTASLITRNTNDIQQVQMLIGMLFRVVVYAPIMGIGGFIKVFTKSDGSMAWIIGIAILAILVIVITLFTVAMPKFKNLQTLIDRLNQVSREILTGIPVIRAFHTEKKEENRFEKANNNLTKTNIFVNRAMSIMMPALIFVMDSIMILIVWFGGKNIDQGVMQVGDMMAFIQYTMQIVMSFLMISMISIMLPRASVSAKRITEVLETEETIKDVIDPKQLDSSKKGLVEFKDVSFRYPDADTEILEDITFTAKPGETTAIIGSTGSGKSTIVNLIPRFYDVTGGEIYIDGVNIKEVTQKDLRDIIGLVPQKGVLFSGTIESNIKYSDELISDEKMKEAAQIAQATNFIEEKDQKYKEKIAQGGTNVSGGQRQRLAIARAIAKDPEIFIFDDSFSALDMKTDAKLREELKSKLKGKTIIIVAQRINTILSADQIIVLEEGKIVGIGTHKELLKENKTYREIALSQLSEKELE